MHCYLIVTVFCVRVTLLLPFNVIIVLTLLYCFPLPRILEDLRHNSHFISFHFICTNRLMVQESAVWWNTIVFIQYFFPVS